MAGTIKKYEVVIIGAGPAGIAAAMWCDELGLDALVVERGTEAGGQLLWTHNPIRNYPGIEAVHGRQLRDKFVRQLDERNITIRTGESASVDLENLSLRMDNGSSIVGGAIIIATGVRRRKLNIPGETAFQDRGMLASGVTAKETVRGKHVVIVGGGDAAVENALVLSESAESVTIVHRGGRLSARDEFISESATRTNVTTLFNSRPTAIVGSHRVEGVTLEGGSAQNIRADAVLIRVGVEPNSDLFRGQLQIDERGYIVVDAPCQTSRSRVFAAGDIASPGSMTIATAVGMAATAARSALAAVRDRFPKN